MGGTEKNAIIAPAGTEGSAPSPETPGSTPAPAETPGAPATPETPAPETPEGAPVSKEPTAVEKRISKLVAQRSEAERQAEYWKGVAEGRRTAGAPAPVAGAPVTPAPDALPQVGDFEVYDDYLVAKAKFELRQDLKRERELENQNRTKTSEQEAHQKFMERLEAAVDTDPDILEDYKDPTLPISPAMASVIRESEAAPKVIRFLINNRKESARIAKLSPLAAAREIGKIEEKVLAPSPKVEKPKTISQAPAPIPTVGAEGKGVVALEDLDINEFMKRRNAQQFGRKG